MTPAQREYITGIAKRLKLPDRMLDGHCVKRFGHRLDWLSKIEASALLDEIIPWEDAPADMYRAMGQQDLPGFGGMR